jgi:STELLO glycosyltransferases
MKTALILTSINRPNAPMRALARGCSTHDWEMIVVGDSKSPDDFRLDECRFLSLEAQRGSGFALGEQAPVGTYTRKNIGYLEAMRYGAEIIVETDDDNHPTDAFWIPRIREVEARPVSANRWVNAYGYFTDNFIYPRGLPLSNAREDLPPSGVLSLHDCPIQQGLADEDPDVDAVYRMLYSLPFFFDKGVDSIVLKDGAWCPFNSQNTTFFNDAFPLLYLPAKCSFRMTDIWRSFVAQRVLQANGSGVMFHEATVRQDRNEHDLHRDFLDEIPGYQHNDAIRDALMQTPLESGMCARVMMENCYQTLIRNEWVGPGEEILLNHWFRDLEEMNVN